MAQLRIWHEVEQRMMVLRYLQRGRPEATGKTAPDTLAKRRHCLAVHGLQSENLHVCDQSSLEVEGHKSEQSVSRWTASTKAIYDRIIAVLCLAMRMAARLFHRERQTYAHFIDWLRSIPRDPRKRGLEMQASLPLSWPLNVRQDWNIFGVEIYTR